MATPNADGVSRIQCPQCGINEETSYTVNLVESSSKDRFDLKAIQDRDRDVSLIKSWLEKGIKPDARAISMESYFFKALYGQWKCKKGYWSRNLKMQQPIQSQHRQ